jgi:hypothetical protein
VTLHRSISILGFIALGVLLICLAIYWSFYRSSGDIAVSRLAALIAGLGMACIAGGVVLFLRTVKLSN